MNQSHKHQLEQAIAKYRAHDASAALAAAYPEQTDLSVEILGPMTGEQFILFSDRVIGNFEQVIASGLWSAFPYQHRSPAGNIDDLAAFTDQFVTHLSRNNCTEAHRVLNQLIKAQLDLGIWSLSEKTKTPSQADVRKMADRLDAQLKRLEAAKALLSEHLEAAKASKAELTAFTAEKRKELDEIKQLLAQARTQLDELAEILKKAQGTNGKVNDIYEQGKKLVDDLNIQLGVIRKEFEGFQDQSSGLLDHQTTQTNASKKLMDEVQKNYEFIKSKEEEIIKLLGMAADAALGTKYDDRGQKIGKGLRFWQWAVPGSVVVAVVWVIVVFTCLKTTEFNEWVNLGINLLKTSPAFILMGFVFTQYSKERNLQEEWLFKAAVAMTINTYADLLEDKDGESNKSRQQLILNALQQVHSPPHLYSEKGGTLFSLRAKELRSVLESLNETMRTLKPGG